MGVNKIMNWNHVVGWGLVVTAVIGLGGMIFSYNIDFSNALYTLAGLGLYFFGIWAAYLLLRK